MSVESLLEAQTTALLRRLAREQETRTRRLSEEAELQSRDIVRRARSEARGRVSQAVTEARREDETAIARRRAAIDTRARRARQQTLRLLLDDAWRRLPDALEARWSATPAREEWCRAACRQALRSLLHLDRLEVEIDSRWAALLADAVHDELGSKATVAVKPVDGLGAGLRIRAADACLDATIGGLLAARERVAAELLAEFEHRMNPVQEPAP